MKREEIITSHEFWKEIIKNNLYNEAGFTPEAAGELAEKVVNELFMEKIKDLSDLHYDQPIIHKPLFKSRKTTAEITAIKTIKPSSIDDCGCDCVKWDDMTEAAKKTFKDLDSL